MGLHEQRSIALMSRRYFVAKYNSFWELFMNQHIRYVYVDTGDV